MSAALRIEPPFWWSGHPVTQLRLLITGTGLRGLAVGATGGLTVGKPKANTAGTALFVDLTIPAGTPPGDYTVTVGTHTLPFPLQPRPAQPPQGLTDDDILYLAMPDRFCDGDPANNRHPLYDPTRPRHYHGGDFEGLRQKLPYLQELGVTALWLTPVYRNADQPTPGLFYSGEPAIDYHGYGAVDLYDTDPRFGSLAALRQLTADAHFYGIKVIQDQVPNHVGPQHPWAKTPPTPRWLNPKRDCSYAAWQLLDPQSTADQRAAMTRGWFGNVLPDLHVEDAEVERYLIQNSLWWVEAAGFAAIRLDTVPYVARSFWPRWRASMAAAYPALSVVGEVLEYDPALVAFFQKGHRGHDGIDTGLERLFDFPLCGALRGLVAGKASLLDVAKTLAHDPLYPDASQLVTFLGLHDLSRVASLPGATPARLQLGLTALFTLRGLPLLYYGDELGMPGGDDPDNRRHFPGGFPGDPRDAFTAAGRTPAEQVLFTHCQRLIALRRRTPALHAGATKHLAVHDDHFAFSRDSVIIVLATKAGRRSIPVAETPLRNGQTLRCALTGQTATVTRHRVAVTLPADGFAVLLPESV